MSGHRQRPATKKRGRHWGGSKSGSTKKGCSRIARRFRFFISSYFRKLECLGPRCYPALILQWPTRNCRLSGRQPALSPCRLRTPRQTAPEATRALQRAVWHGEHSQGSIPHPYPYHRCGQCQRKLRKVMTGPISEVKLRPGKIGWPCPHRLPTPCAPRVNLSAALNALRLQRGPRAQRPASSGAFLRLAPAS